MARVIRYIFISFLIFILMSHNTYAVDYSVNVQRVWSNFTTTNINWNISTQTATHTGIAFTANQDNTVIHSIEFVSLPGMTCTAGDIYEFNFNLYNLANNNSLDVFFNAITIDSVYPGWEFVNWESQDFGNSAAHLTLHVLQTTNGGSTCRNGILFAANANSSYMLTLMNQEGMRLNTINIYRPVSVNGSSSFDDTDILNAINNLRTQNNTRLDEIIDGLENAAEAEENAANDAVEEAQTQSDNSQSSVDSTTTNLFGALNSIGSALINAPATDCIINISTRQFSVGQVNLCSNVPQEVLNFTSGLLAIVLTPIVLYYVFHIVTYIYNLFQEFQR